MIFNSSALAGACLMHVWTNASSGSLVMLSSVQAPAATDAAGSTLGAGAGVAMGASGFLDRKNQAATASAINTNRPTINGISRLFFLAGTGAGNTAGSTLTGSGTGSGSGWAVTGSGRTNSGTSGISRDETGTVGVARLPLPSSNGSTTSGPISVSRASPLAPSLKCGTLNQKGLLLQALWSWR